MPDYETLLTATVIGDDVNPLYPLIEEGNWRFLLNSQRYRERETKEIVFDRKFVQLRDDFTDAQYPIVATHTESLSDGDIDVPEYLKRMAKFIRDAHTAQWMLGAGGYNRIEQVAIEMLQRTLGEQFDYLRQLGEDIVNSAIENAVRAPRRIVTSRGLYNRGVMFVESQTQSAERGRATTYQFHPDQLPQYPGDGNQLCLTRCRCHWRFRFPKDTVSYYHAYWTLAFFGLPDGKNCTTCLQNWRQWSPYTVLRF